jgi:uncharacterized integral membrane protein
MDNLWLKIKIWTKVVIISVVVIFLLIFVMENANKEITIWWWFGREVATTALMLIGCMFLAGVICTLLVRVAAKTMRQVRELKQHNANLQMRQDVAEIKTKAAMLQTKPPITPSDAANKGN